MADNAAVLTREFVPQELHDRPYLKDYLDKPWDKTVGAEFFKKLDGAESLIGKRPAIPDPKTAKPEELDKFFEQFRPEKPEEYEVPVAKDAKVDEGFVKIVREAFHEGRLNKTQAARVLAKFNEYGVAQQKTALLAKQKADLEFDTLAKTMLGQENKATMERVRKLIGEHAPPVAREMFNKLKDEELVGAAAVIDAIFKKYAPEDELSGKGNNNGGGTGNGTAEEKRTRARALILEISKMKPMDPERDKKQTVVNQLYKEIAEAM